MLLVAVLTGPAVGAAGCGDGGGPSAEEEFTAEARAAVTDLLGDQSQPYTDEELVTFGRRACDNLAELEDGEDLRRAIEAASVGATDSETLQVAQATVLVQVAAEHLCPDEGERLGLLDVGASAGDASAGSRRS